MSKSYREIAYDAGVHKNWDDFRVVYDKLTIYDLIWINTSWDTILPPQHHASVHYFKKMFRKIGRDYLRVVELGCHRGRLASEVMRALDGEAYGIKEWVGYDINHAAIRDCSQHAKFQGVALTNWFWEVFPTGFDVFVCAHTLEHFNREQAGRILQLAIEDCKYILLEVPVAEQWRNYRGSHVLRASHRDFDQFLGYTHRRFANFSSKKILIGGWETRYGNH